jgi:signal transduction histidine kinase
VASCAAACLLAVGRRPETRARETEREEELRSLSHELKTPLSALALCHDLLDSERLGPLNDRQRQALDGGRRSLARLRADYARMVETICSPEWRANSLLIDVDLAAVAREAVAAIEPLAAARGLEVECDLPERIPLRGDRERLRQLLGNLLSNAVKYNRPGGRIVLRARREGADVRVEVSDTGLGVSEEEHGLLFEEHYRGSSAADSGAHGDGLGLAIVKRAVELHGGRISLESQQGRGTTFTVMLPGNTV